MNQPFTLVRRPPLALAVDLPARRPDIYYDCIKPGHFSAQCANPYRPRERRQPRVVVHSLADIDADEGDDDDKDVPGAQIEDLKPFRPGARARAAQRNTKA